MTGAGTNRDSEGERSRLTGIAIVGCGYVADFYMRTIPNHPELKLIGAYDRDDARLQSFCNYHGVRRFDTLAALLEDSRVDLVLNLTNPASHFEISKEALRSGKHVYSEKPLTLTVEHARQLAALAHDNGLSLAAAPATYLGESALALKSAISEGRVGKVRVVYAELDDGMVYRAGCEAWRSASGAPWPFEDEFEIGCTLQHASYYISWLCDLFGPVRAVTAFASRQVDDKVTGLRADRQADDFSVSCLEFDDGIVARLTCGLLAPRDRRLRIVGDLGVLTVEDGWDTRSKVTLEPASGRRSTSLSGRFRSALSRLSRTPERQTVKVLRATYRVPQGHPGRLDYARGPALQAQAIQSKANLTSFSGLAVHVTEVALAIANARLESRAQSISTSF